MMVLRADKFTFFEVNGKIENYFKTVYDLHMRVKALSKALVFLNMQNVFQIIPESTVEELHQKLTDLFVC